MKENSKPMPSWARAVAHVLLGAFIGIGAILPGLSGGVMCVIFGIYAPLMETMANPISGIKKYWKLLLPVILGVAVGFVCFGGILDLLIEKNRVLMFCIFIGLILGTLPSLWKEAGKEKRTKGSYTALIIAFVLMFSVFSVFGAVSDDPTDMAKAIGNALSIEQIESEDEKNDSPADEGAVQLPDTPCYIFILAGVICGISVIVPGMSFSSPLMCLGLWTPLTANLKAIMSFELGGVGSFLIPFAIGGLATVLLLAKPVNLLFKNYSSIAYHFVFGSVLASLVLLIPLNFANAYDIIYCLLGLIGGTAAGYALDVLQSKIKVEE